MIHFTLILILHYFVIIETQHTLLRTGHVSCTQEPHGFEATILDITHFIDKQFHHCQKIYWGVQIKMNSKYYPVLGEDVGKQALST